MTHYIRPYRLVALSIALCTLTVSAKPAFAQQQPTEEKIYFTAVDKGLNGAKQAIIDKINAERARVDIGMWILVDGDITQTIINKHKSGVPVRVIGDRITIFEQADKNTYNLFLAMANAGVPIRVRRQPTDFPAILHWKAGIFAGQGIVEFGSANWTTFELEPWSDTDFKDETAMFTNDQTIFHAFLTMFDNYWVDTQYFEDWNTSYKAETGQTWTVPMNISRVKAETVQYDTSILGWSQGPELSTAMIAEMKLENAPGSIDMVSYRLTDLALTDALIARKNAGVNVRVFIEPTQYRNDGYPEFWLVGAMTDKLWMAGIPIKQRDPPGTHAHEDPDYLTVRTDSVLELHDQLAARPQLLRSGEHQAAAVPVSQGSLQRDVARHQELHGLRSAAADRTEDPKPGCMEPSMSRRRRSSNGSARHLPRPSTFSFGPPTDRCRPSPRAG